jgi:uncharacterized protein (DUF1015 family)
VHSEEVYQKAVENFIAEWQKKGWLVDDRQNHFYIYAQTMNGRTQYGIVGRCSSDRLSVRHN